MATTQLSETSLAWHSMLGFRMNAMSIGQLNDYIVVTRENRGRAIIGNHNLHSLCLWHQDGDVRKFYSQADCVHIDGMGIVLLARLLRMGITRDERVTYVDWIPSLIQLAARRRWRVFYLGCKPGVAEIAAARFRQEYPTLVITTEHGYFDVNGMQNEAVVRRICEFHPDLLIVGMGMPRQEKWVAKNLEKLPEATILTAGGAFDYFAGIVPTPPRWAGKMGLEWLFRLIAEPGRLWRRYLVEPWVLAFLILLNLDRQNRFGRRHTPPPDAESSNEEKLIVSPPPIRNTAGGDPKRAR